MATKKALQKLSALSLRGWTIAIVSFRSRFDSTFRLLFFFCLPFPGLFTDVISLQGNAPVVPRQYPVPISANTSSRTEPPLDPPAPRCGAKVRDHDLDPDKGGSARGPCVFSSNHCRGCSPRSQHVGVLTRVLRNTRQGERLRNPASVGRWGLAHPSEAALAGWFAKATRPSPGLTAGLGFGPVRWLRAGPPQRA